MEIFEYIIENINEKGEVIDNNEPIIEHITKVINPYFFSYYNTAIKTVQNCISGYENYVKLYSYKTNNKFAN